MLPLADAASLIHQKLSAETFEQLKQTPPLSLREANVRNALLLQRKIQVLFVQVSEHSRRGQFGRYHP